MQILYLEPVETFLVDILAWVFFHFSIGYLSTKIPLRWLNPDLKFFKTFTWEKGGQIYEQWFRVKSWKKFIPNGSAMYKGAFSVKNLKSMDLAYLYRWLKESIRSEICHWAMILPGFLFFFWNNVQTSWFMVVYAVLNNLVPIIMQRFNRPRMRKLLKHMERKKELDGEPVYGYASQTSCLRIGE